MMKTAVVMPTRMGIHGMHLSALKSLALETLALETDGKRRKQRLTDDKWIIDSYKYRFGSKEFRFSFLLFCASEILLWITESVNQKHLTHFLFPISTSHSLLFFTAFIIFGVLLLFWGLGLCPLFFCIPIFLMIYIWLGNPNPSTFFGWA